MKRKAQPQQPRYDLDYILSNTCQDMEHVASCLKEGHDEHWQVQVIKKHLLTDAQRRQLQEWDLSIEDCLNGRIEMESSRNIYVCAMFENWNYKLRERIFGYGG